MTDLPEHFDLASQDPLVDRISALRPMFPDIFREEKIDVDALRRTLGDWADPGPERFGLTWPGKSECMRIVQQPSIGTLVPIRDESIEFGTSENVIIEGENLEVLKLLQKAYYGTVKLIYIDPPYNTGKEFIYPDNFREGLADYLRYSGQVDEEGFKLSANAETDGRYHSKWLSMMYPRLFLARNLLREDGVLMVSIADHEVAALRCLLSEIFGEENFIGTIVWKNVTDNNPSRVVVEHEYLMLYARNRSGVPAEWKSQVVPARDRILEIEKDLLARFEGEALQREYETWFRENKSFLKPMEGYKFVDEQGVFAGSRSVHNPGKEGYRFDVIHPTTGRVCKAPLMGYRFPEDTFKSLLESGRIIFGDDEAKLIELKVYAREFKMKLSSVLELDGRSGANRLRSLFPEAARVFTNPKPVELMTEIFSFILGPDDLVFDFFAGSGTTAEAVLTLNAEDQGQRRFLLAQLPEPIDSEHFPTISAIARERVRRAARQLGEAGNSDQSKADLGFRSFFLSSSNFSIWDSAVVGQDQVEAQLQMAVDHVVAEATELSMVTELLLKAGYALTSQVEEVTFADSAGYSVADGALLVCLSRQLSVSVFEAMVEFDPAMILVLDAGFGGSDELKVNAVQTVRSRNQRAGSDIVLRVV